MRLISLVGALCVLVCSSGLALAYAPERFVVLDFKWLSPPSVEPTTGEARAEQLDGFTRLEASATVPEVGVVWPLRYAVEVDRYPIVSFRYRASNLRPGEQGGAGLFQTELIRDRQTKTVTIATFDEIIQDGAVHELRKTLAPVAGGYSVDGLRFNFDVVRTPGRLDIFEVRFENGPGSLPVVQLPHERLDYAVVDEAGRAIAGAEVRAGILERSNWSSEGVSDATGRVSLLTTLPLGPDGKTPEAVEMVVTKNGYLPQYVAPVDYPRNTPVIARMTESTTTSAGGVSTAFPVAQVPGGVIYAEAPSSTFWGELDDVVVIYPYASGWWVPGYHVPYGWYGNRWYDRDYYRRDWDRDGARRYPPRYWDGRQRPIHRPEPPVTIQPIQPVPDIHHRPRLEDIHRRPRVEDIHRRPRVEDIHRRPIGSPKPLTQTDKDSSDR